MAQGLVLHEQRTLARRELIYYLKITDQKTGQEIGRMGDLNTGGMLVLSEKPLLIGAVYQVALELPKAMQTDEIKNVLLKFEAMWTRPGPKNSTYKENGTRFIDLNEFQQRIIYDLIDLFAMP